MEVQLVSHHLLPQQTQLGLGLVEQVLELKLLLVPLILVLLLEQQGEVEVQAELLLQLELEQIALRTQQYSKKCIFFKHVFWFTKRKCFYAKKLFCIRRGCKNIDN